ncbi:uncharacterized protein LY89DRAFT_752376 [Mollisia scopiformis]|uniref:Delta(24)-sterol reductase n=1 Tax=Mollisia scopiformis TaxID=149040 RepID=A0A194X2G1_MOLSC|nr:uncharacterized protein LY89DRAFT_752376 [Mollisia scopiformis]KUJ14390.1 hypothetical protein LY89DRAFT_752376 [Mollisia scopiformis]
MDKHDEAVTQIADRVRKFYARKEAFRIYHGSTNSTRQSHFQRDRMVDTSGFNYVKLGVSINTLVKTTLNYSLIPLFVIEFPGITLGGGFVATAGEASSFLFRDGEVVRASAIERSDLFYRAASSFGTLGLTTMLEVQLIEAKAYVALTYHPVTSIIEAQREIETATKDPTCDYLDGIMYSEIKGVICAGRLTNDIGLDTKVQKFTRPSDPWFYLHAYHFTAKHTSPITEAIPLVDYLFRYDRGGFWVARYAYTYFLTPFNRVIRYLLDHYMHTRVLYHAVHRSGLSSQYIIQEVAIPYPQTATFMTYLATTFKNYPIWLCPLKQSGKGIASTHSLQVDKLNQKFVTWNRDFEQKVHELGGQKWLYAHTYYIEQEFDEIYNRKEYDALRKKYSGSYLPSVYEKEKVDISKEKVKAENETWREWTRRHVKSAWPLQGLYGVYKAAMNGEYLLARTEKKAGKME